MPLPEIEAQMTDSSPITGAIVDYGLGNLFSVRQACERAGIRAVITSSGNDILNAHVVLLPGVGSYGEAMATLHRLDLVDVLKKVASSDKPLVGICLGAQLLMTESYEFGKQEGLKVIEGSVVRLGNSKESNRRLKVPQVGWNRIYPATDWTNTLLDGVAAGEYMYFVHSFVIQPRDKNLVLSTSRYGHIEFCSSLRYRNIFACQFHPERSGPEGLKVYYNLAKEIRRRKQGEPE
jgi:glutamine amidotransferase